MKVATTVYKRKSKITGAISFVAQVRVAPYAAQQETFRVRDDIKASRLEARAWAEAKEIELSEQAKRGISKDLTTITVAKLINAYVEAPETRQRKSFPDIERLVGWWLEHYGNIKMLDFGDDTMRAARDKLMRDKADPATTNRYVSQMRRCWNWGISAKKVPRDRPWAVDLMLKEPAGRTRYLDDEERAALLDAASPNPVMHTAVLVSVATGMRQDEMLSLIWKHVDLDKGIAMLLETKNGAARAVHIPSTAVEALRKLKKASKVVSLAGHVFVIAEGKPLKSSTLIKRFKKLLKTAKIIDFTWHDLRHTCASYLAQNGATLLEIGSVLGHKSPSVTMRYAHLVQGKAVTGHAALDKLLGGAK